MNISVLSLEKIKNEIAVDYMKNIETINFFKNFLSLYKLWTIVTMSVIL